MNCNYYRDLLHEFMEDSLPPEITDEVRTHLEICPSCNIVFKTYQLTIKLSRGAETCRDVSEDEIGRLKNYLKNCILQDK